jgi:lysophospholipase L1-like esterase
MQRVILWIVISIHISSAALATITQRIVFIGDSLTANPNLLARQMLPERVGRIVGEHFVAQSIAAPGATMANQGFILGFGSQTGLFDVLGRVYPPQAVVILLGTNDYDATGGTGVTTADFGAAYSSFLAAIPAGVPVVCITPPWFQNESIPNSHGYTLEDYRVVIRQVCAGRTIVEGGQAIPHDPAYYVSGPHPNNLGTELLSRAVGAALKPLLGL